jgi:Flp pilus assembly pilin Flp
MRDQRGQTTPEYAALLALVAAVLAGTGAVVGLGGVAAAVAAGVRTGICIVAGDVCRASDAAAAGLSPCTVAEHTRGQGLTFTIASVRFGADDGWIAARRSDGSVLITRVEHRRLGASVGLGVEASPLGLELGVDAKLEYALGSGRAWAFPDAAAAARFLRSGDRDEVEPTWRFGEAGAVLAGGADAGAAGMELTELEASAEGGAGVRVGRGLTTHYLRAGYDMLDVRASLPGATARFEGPGARAGIIEVTRDAAGLRELAFRMVGPGTRGGQVVETVARLDLRDPGNRAAAEPLLSRRLPWPPGLAREVRAAMRRAAATGIVERAVYDVRDGTQEVKLAAKLGLVLGIDGKEVEVDRRLVAASAWTHGSRERERADCGVTAA